MSRQHLLPDAGPVVDIHQAVYVAARDYRGGVTALAATVVLPYDTFQKKISVANATHHLMLHEFMAVAEAVDDDRIDDAFARARGKLLFKPQPVPATRQALEALGKMLAAEGAFVGSLHEGVADNKWEQHEVEKLEHCAHKVISEILGICAGARQASEGNNHG